MISIMLSSHCSVVLLLLTSHVALYALSCGAMIVCSNVSSAGTWAIMSLNSLAHENVKQSQEHFHAYVAHLRKPL
jgi:uncharacterized protein YsxB (DUF464 family)